MKSRKAVVGGREFLIEAADFENGCAVFVSEGPGRLGSITVSLATGPAPVTAEVIPARAGSLFLRMVAERLSTRLRGVALVSLYAKGDLGGEESKKLMSEVVELVG
ncbi:MAG: hypothetical protein MPI95_06935 [Nitrosopumilus sp.]|nr:hypothetical protein [Nitrosopumilus sp.]CAI9830940.1 conserved hypothetical protein [Nitrosopumilaceae archaeon]MDA7942214.1 hypothetical protein [Nitrosopumilus sp.]MDA7944111.1 hypothetical protein [Nitrosopumilus sp.]MDA7945646.1 hypothetical protein [Nitrosopumilus sp.]